MLHTGGGTLAGKDVSMLGGAVSTVTGIDLGFFMIGWSDEKKGMHDMICLTRVVHGKPQPRNLSTVFE